MPSPSSHPSFLGSCSPERPEIGDELFDADMRNKIHRNGANLLMRPKLVGCNVAIYCTLVVRNIVMVGCAEPWFTQAMKSTVARANQKARGHCKLRCSAENYQDIRRDLRAMDRSISNQQIEPHQNVSGIAAMLFADRWRVPSRRGRGMSRR